MKFSWASHLERSPLLDFQKVAADFLHTKRRAILGSEVGTGKTPTSIVPGAHLEGRTLVICPASLRLMWADRIKQFDPEYRSVQVVEEGKDVPAGKNYTVMSFERYASSGGVDIPQCSKVIIDEAHNLKNPESKRSQAVFNHRSMVRRADFTWLLTATPFPNNIADCYSLFAFCTGGRVGTYWDFVERYAFREKNAFGTRAVGVKMHMLPELVALMSPYLHRDFVADVLPEMPPEEEIFVPVRASGNAPIPTMEKSIEDEILESIRTDRTLMPAEEENLSKFMREFGLRKVQAASEFVTDLLNQGKQVVVVARHVDVVTGLCDSIRKLEPSCESIYGLTPVDVREAHKARFQSGDLRCLVLSSRTGSEGIDLFSSHIMVTVELGWTPKERIQVKGRIRRMGQQNRCLFYDVIIPESFDQRLYKVVQEKTKTEDEFWRLYREKKAQEPKAQRMLEAIYGKGIQ